jgi:hypothetical protein
MYRKTPHVFVVTDVPSKMTREQLIDFYSNSISVMRAKIYKLYWSTSETFCKFGVIQTDGYEDVIKASTRFLGSLKKRSRIYHMRKDSRFTDALIKRPLTICATSHNPSSALLQQMIADLKSLGNIQLIDHSISVNGIEVVFQADTDYSYGSLTTTGEVQSAVGEYWVETLEEDLLEGELPKLIHVIEPFYYHTPSQGQEEVTIRIPNSPKERASLFEECASRDRAQHSMFRTGIGFSDELSDCEDETEVMVDFQPQLVSNNSCMVFFEDRIENPLLNMIENQSQLKASSIPVLQDKGLAVLAGCQTSPEALAEFGEKTQAANLKNEERTLEAMKKLQKLSIVIDEEFFESVKSKIDPRTPGHDLLRVALKIIKTKLRKIKRRDRRRASKKNKDNGTDSEEDDDDDSENQKANVPKAEGDRVKEKPSSMTGANLLDYPHDWVRFVKSLQPSGSVETYISNSLNPLSSVNDNPEKSEVIKVHSQQIHSIKEEDECSLDQDNESKRENNAPLYHELFPNYKISYMVQDFREEIVAGLKSRLQSD